MRSKRTREDLARRRSMRARVCGRPSSVFHKTLLVGEMGNPELLDRHWSGTECAQRKRGRNKRNESMRVPRTNWSSVTFVPKLNPQGRYF